MEGFEHGAQRSDSIPEVGEDAANTVQPASDTSLTEEEQEELRSELVKVEEEIQTLTQVLASKERHLADIKRKLGITPFNELKQNLSRGWQEVTTSTAYRRTSETLSQAGQKATAAFSSVGSAISRKLEDVSIRSIQHSSSMPVMRNTPTFKSFEDKVETLKTKVSPTGSSTELGNESDSTVSAEPGGRAARRDDCSHFRATLRNSFFTSLHSSLLLPFLPSASSLHIAEKQN